MDHDISKASPELRSEQAQTELADDRSDAESSASIPRVLQFHGKRYSLRIEDIFWSEFAQAARRRGVREAELIARLARSGGGSLASRVRTFCMAETKRVYASVAATSVAATDRSVLSTALGVAPLPALLVSMDGTILFHNRSLETWLADESDHTGRKMHELFSIRSSLDWTAIAAEARKRSPEPLQMHVVRIAKGKTLAAVARLTVLSTDGADDTDNGCCIVWLNAGQPGRITRSLEPIQQA